MITDRVRQIAAESGVGLAERLPHNEVVSFVAEHNGDVVITLASGEVVRAVNPTEIPVTDQDRQLNLYLHLRRLAPDLQIGIPVFRRSILIGDGKRGVIFVEAGR